VAVIKENRNAKKRRYVGYAALSADRQATAYRQTVRCAMPGTPRGAYPTPTMAHASKCPKSPTCICWAQFRCVVRVLMSWRCSIEGAGECETAREKCRDAQCASAETVCPHVRDIPPTQGTNPRTHTVRPYDKTVHAAKLFCIPNPHGKSVFT